MTHYFIIHQHYAHKAFKSDAETIEDALIAAFKELRPNFATDHYDVGVENGSVVVRGRQSQHFLASINYAVIDEATYAHHATCCQK